MPLFEENISDDLVSNDFCQDNQHSVENILDVVISHERFQITAAQGIVVRDFLSDLFFAFSEGVEANGNQIVGPYPDFQIINTLAKGRIRNAFAAGISTLLNVSKLKDFPDTADGDTVTLASLGVATGKLTFVDGILTEAINPT